MPERSAPTLKQRLDVFRADGMEGILHQSISSSDMISCCIRRSRRWRPADRCHSRSLIAATTKGAQRYLATMPRLPHTRGLSSCAQNPMPDRPSLGTAFAQNDDAAAPQAVARACRPAPAPRDKPGSTLALLTRQPLSLQPSLYTTHVEENRVLCHGQMVLASQPNVLVCKKANMRV